MNARFDPLGLYFGAIRKIEPISEKEVKSLWIKSKTDKAAFNRLVEQNYRLVINIPLGNYGRKPVEEKNPKTCFSVSMLR